MTGRGWYLMHRGWMDDELFAGEPFSKAQAWVWLIEKAAWEATSTWVGGDKVKLNRGQLAISQRHLAETWGWGRQQVRTFVEKLKVDEKITVAVTHGATIVTICNYDKYQITPSTEQPTEQPKANPAPTHEQPKVNEEKESNTGLAARAREGAVPHNVAEVSSRVMQLARMVMPPIDLPLVEAWLEAGADPAKHIYPVVEKLASRKSGIRRLSYFDSAVREAIASERQVDANGDDAISRALRRLPAGPNPHWEAQQAARRQQEQTNA